MNETGILRRILPSSQVRSRQAVPSKAGFLLSMVEGNEVSEGKEIAPKVREDNTQIPRKVCGGCGGARFIPCTRCHGSKKSCFLKFPQSGSNGSRTMKSRENIVSLKCSLCSRGTGLIRCPMCCPASSLSSFSANSSLVSSTLSLSSASSIPSPSSPKMSSSC